MDQGYYALDDILADEEKIACIFNVDAIGLGHLDETSDEKDLKKDTAVELPLWMAQALVLKNMVKLKLPKYFGDSFRVTLLAQPAVMNLQDRSPFFYEFGLKLANLVRDPEIVNMLQRAFQARYQEILKRSPLFPTQDFSKFTAMLTSLEMKLYQTKYVCTKEQHAWQNRRTHRLTPAEVCLADSATSSGRGSKRKL